MFGNSGDSLSVIEDVEFAMTDPKAAVAPKDSGKTNPISADIKVDDVESEDETDYLTLKRNTRGRAPPLKKIAFESQKEDDKHDPERKMHSNSASRSVQQSSQENTSDLPSVKVLAKSALSNGHSPHSNQVNLPLSNESVIVLEDDPAPRPRGNVRSKSPSGPAIFTKYERSSEIAHMALQDVLSEPPGNGLHPIPLDTESSIKPC